jgi:hypothetical protein
MIIVFPPSFAVLRIKPRILLILSKCCMAELRSCP